MKLGTFRLIATLMIVLPLVAACGGAAPSATPLPATATEIVVAATSTPSPPTATPAPPTATQTSLPPSPTATVTATATKQAPSPMPTEAVPLPTAAPTTRPGYFSRDDLIEDARQLADAIESAHPDPYIRGGGRIAFHRHLQRLLNAIPAEGMTRDEFLRLLRPFVAAVGDSHTEIWGDYQVNDSRPGGVPLLFHVVQGSLYVAGVPHASQEISPDLLGATLVSVEGVPLAELVERQKRLAALENEYNVLDELARRTLWYKPYLQDLLPEWQDTGEISVELQLPGGQIEAFAFTLPVNMLGLQTPDTQVRLPTVDRSGFRYSLVDAEGRIAYLRVEHLTHYREAQEMATGGPAPQLRSATETFRSLVLEMEEAGSDTLIVDLRGNQGGHSVMGDILLYFLYGKEALQSTMVHADSIGGGMVRKYSDLFWERTSSWTSLEQVNEGRALLLRADDYDFAGYSGDVEWSPARKAEAIAHSEKNWLALSPTFWEEYQSEVYSGYYRPENVLVLVDTGTFSSGFTMARYLYLAGAILVGTPSSQAANSFGNGQLWHLDHTGIEGTVSTTYSVMFPDDSALARVLPVHYSLTYETLAAYDFDPNAEYLYALELLPDLVETPDAPIALMPEGESAKPAPQPAAASLPGYRYGRDELIEDARQLADTLENAHPDPYIRGGGKIAFHRRLQRLLNAIPAEGMTRDEFVGLLRPFIAAVGDSHTSIWDVYPVDGNRPGGVPLQLGIVEESLYVSGVPDREDSDLIGSLLVSVEGVPLAELCERQAQVQSTENEYHALQVLAGLSLWYRPFMQDLLPEWQDDSRVRVELQRPDGEIEEYAFDLPESMYNIHTANSRVRLPTPDRSGFLYDFLDAEGKTAYLRVDDMMHYREAYEIWATVGSVETAEATRATIPSATETFRDLVVEMKEAGTEALIIDLRHNNGGVSLMSDILLYFLYEKQDLMAILTHTLATGGAEIRRYSRLYFENYPNESIEDYNEGRTVPLIEGDYDFDADFTDDLERFQEVMQQSETPAFVDEGYQRAPTFYAEYESGAYGGYYRPERILVLVTSGTFSSGFTMARHLYLAGATLVGTPSAQASNCFGDLLWWELNHTRIKGGISHAYFVDFPDDPEVGRVLPVHYPLTYEKLASYDFDPNAEYLYALELLPELEGQ